MFPWFLFPSLVFLRKKERLKRKALCPWESETDKQTGAQRGHFPTWRRRRRREKGSNAQREWFQKVCQVHLPFPSMNTSENEYLVELWVCSCFGPSSPWLPKGVHLAALKVISIFTLLPSSLFLVGEGVICYWSLATKLKVICPTTGQFEEILKHSSK